MFLEDIPMECKIIDGSQIVWSRRYRGVDYVYSHVSLEAAYTLGRKELTRHNKLYKKHINSTNDGVVFL